MIDERHTRSRRRLISPLLASACALLVVAVPVALASHGFTDVPDSNPFHGDISAIALAGITTGKTCTPPGTPPTYCPDEIVERQAMAAFMHRGFGRVGQTYLPPTNVVTGGFSTPAGWTLDITPGLPPGALAGAAGFVKVDASVNVCNNRTDFIFQLGAIVRLDGVAIPGYFGVQDVLPEGCSVIALTGAGTVTTAGPHTVSVQLAGGSGVGDEFFADGVVTATYHPFGAAGTNVLGSATASADLSAKVARLGPRPRS